MDMQVMEALEDTRPEPQFAADWQDVLRRAHVAPEPRPLVVPRRPARRRPARLLALAALLLAGVALLVPPAFGLRAEIGSFFDVARGPHPSGSWELAGGRVHTTGKLWASAVLTHVETSSLRLIASGGGGYRRVELVGGIGPDRRPWLAQLGPGWVSNFFPLFGAVGEVERPVWRTRTAHGWDGWQFPMYGRSSEHRALFSYLAFGGREPGTVTWATLVGFTRPDVVRLVVETAAGTRRPVVPAANGGFRYAALRAGDVPRTLTAIGSTGRVVGRERFTLRTFSP
jgi:hypothetical protein